jgi:Family of unknown function (DUF6308)
VKALVVTVALRGEAVVVDPFAVALGFLEAYGAPRDDAQSSSFVEADLRAANRGGARISAAEIAAILERRAEIEGALRAIAPAASLTRRSLPWAELTRLFDAFGDIPGVGFSKMTKALHPKRPALVPMLDSVVQKYLGAPSAESFGEQATELVRRYKQDLDRNRLALRELKGELASRGYQVTEVRILDLLIWSALAADR